MCIRLLDTVQIIIKISFNFKVASSGQMLLVTKWCPHCWTLIKHATVMLSVLLVVSLRHRDHQVVLSGTRYQPGHNMCMTIDQLHVTCTQ